MNTFTPFYILSGALSGFSAQENCDRTESLDRWLRAKSLATVQVNGRYKSNRERSILVIDERPDNDFCESAVMLLARQYDQESVLAVDANRQARLIYWDDGRFESVGQWRAVSAGEVTNKPDASYTERAGQYYTVT